MLFPGRVLWGPVISCFIILSFFCVERGGAIAVLVPGLFGKEKWWIVKVVIIGILLTKHTSVADMWEQVTTTDVIMSHLRDVKLSTQLNGHFWKGGKSQELKLTLNKNCFSHRLQTCNLLMKIVHNSFFMLTLIQYGWSLQISFNFTVVHVIRVCECNCGDVLSLVGQIIRKLATSGS